MLNRISIFIQSPKTKRAGLGIWIALVVTAIVFYIIFPKEFTAKGIQLFVVQFNGTAMTVYAMICLIRGLFLIPSTPFVLAGALLFPNQLWLVFIISLLGITGSGTFIYYAAQFLDFGKKKGKKISKINQKVRKYGFWIVLVWAFFPAVPTDLICYVAGRTRMSFWKYISALFIGEALLIGLYLYFCQNFLVT
ncbi:MAG: VTT domain-containing protein [Crocinitomicaceae bacterium]|nr:VTT domain-containing protein [Crocinitomicaceae bacterium]